MNDLFFVNFSSLFLMVSVLIAGFIVGGSNIRNSLLITRDTCVPIGIVATLIGFVKMLQRLDDPTSLGPALAVALLTTLYGFILFVILDSVSSYFPQKEQTIPAEDEIDSLMM